MKAPTCVTDEPKRRTLLGVERQKGRGRSRCTIKKGTEEEVGTLKKSGRKKRGIAGGRTQNP